MYSFFESNGICLSLLLYGKMQDGLNICLKKNMVKYGPRREKTCLRELANNPGADQPAHPRSLISAFVIRFLESIICLLSTGIIAIF